MDHVKKFSSTICIPEIKLLDVLERKAQILRFPVGSGSPDHGANRVLIKQLRDEVQRSDQFLVSVFAPRPSQNRRIGMRSDTTQ